MPAKTVAIGVYLIFFVLGCATLGLRMWVMRSDAFAADPSKSFAHLTATHDLPANHRLVEDDLVAPNDMPAAFAIHLPQVRAFVGLYLTTAVRATQPVTPENLRAGPRLPVIGGGFELRVVPLASQTHVLRWLDAGSRIRVQTSKTLEDGSVVAITCPEPEAGKALELAACAVIVSLERQADADASSWLLQPGAPNPGGTSCNSCGVRWWTR